MENIVYIIEFVWKYCLPCLFILVVPYFVYVFWTMRKYVTDENLCEGIVAKADLSDTYIDIKGVGLRKLGITTKGYRPKEGDKIKVYWHPDMDNCKIPFLSRTVIHENAGIGLKYSWVFLLVWLGIVVFIGMSILG